MKSLCSFELFSRFAHLRFLTYPSDFQCPQVSSDFPVIFHILYKDFVEKSFCLLSRVIVAHLVLALHYHQGSCRALKILHQPNKDSSGYKIWLHRWCWRYKIIQAIYNSLMETLIIPVKQIICNETRAPTFTTTAG
jgi:hypothetical protein